MAKDKHKFTVEVDADDLGVCTKHDFLMANDQDYRHAALTPPGGHAPGTGGKEPEPCPDGSGLSAASLVAAGAH